MSLEMAQKVIAPQKKNYVPQFLKQRDINSYYSSYPSRKQKTRQFTIKVLEKINKLVNQIAHPVLNKAYT
jgi:hypothetical protein